MAKDFDVLAEEYVKRFYDFSQDKIYDFCERKGIMAHEGKNKLYEQIMEIANARRNPDLEIFDRKILTSKRFGFDFHEGNVFHGAYIGDKNGNAEPILVFDGKKIMREAFFVENNIKFGDYPGLTKQFELYGWDRQAIKKWLKDGQEVEIRKLYSDIRNYLKKYI